MTLGELCAKIKIIKTGKLGTKVKVEAAEIHMQCEEHKAAAKSHKQTIEMSLFLL